MLQGYVPEVTATGSKEKFRKKVMEEARKNSYMKIIDLLFFKKKQECSESDWHNKGMIEICEKYYSDIKENIQDDRLSIHSVWGYLRHIPRGKEDVGYSKDVYAIADKCFHELYNYSINKVLLERVWVSTNPIFHRRTKWLF